MFPIIFVILFAIYLFLIFPSFRRHPDRAWMEGLFIAHRGVHNQKAGLPENSLLAFTAARKLGFAIELDVRLTADGEVVVFHDDHLQRVCGVEGRVSEMTLSQLQQLRLLGSEQTIPTLQQVLKTVDGEVPLLIEFKCEKNDCRALCKAVDALMREYNGKYLVQSFYPPVLFWYRRHHRRICRGILATNFWAQKNSKFYAKLAALLLFNFVARPDFVSYEARFGDCFARCICAALGAFPIGWTYKSADAVVAEGYNRAFIFEGFLPEKPYRQDQ